MEQMTADVVLSQPCHEGPNVDNHLSSEHLTWQPGINKWCEMRPRGAFATDGASMLETWLGFADRAG